MLKQLTYASDAQDLTMSALIAQQLQECERSLFSHPNYNLFSENITDFQVQSLYETSYYSQEEKISMPTLSKLREKVLQSMEQEFYFLGESEVLLLEKMVLNNGRVKLSIHDDIRAADALVKRLFCNFYEKNQNWYLCFPTCLHAKFLEIYNKDEYLEMREKLNKFDNNIMAFLYIMGVVNATPLISFFMKEMINQVDEVVYKLLIRYLKANFKFQFDSEGQMILVHPGVANVEKILSIQKKYVGETLELSQDMVDGAKDGILYEEVALHNALSASLLYVVRPEYNASEVAEDLRMLVKQGVNYEVVENVLKNHITINPNQRILDLLDELYLFTPRLIGITPAVIH